MDSFGEALKIFLNKHLTATIISIFISLLFNLILPNDYWMIKKIGLNAFRVFIFCICFIFIQLIIWIVKKIKKILTYYTLKKEDEEIKNKEIEDNINKWRTVADKMSPQDRNAILELINNNNTPIPSYEFSVSDFHSIYYTQCVHKAMSSNGIELVKLTDGCFKVYSYIYKKYGMLGNFG